MLLGIHGGPAYPCVPGAYGYNVEKLLIPQLSGIAKVLLAGENRVLLI